MSSNKEPLVFAGANALPVTRHSSRVEHSTNGNHLTSDNELTSIIRYLCCYCRRDGVDVSYTLMTPESTLSGQSRWVWIALAMNYLTIGSGYVYDVSSIMVALYEPTFKPVKFMAIKAMPATCQFVIPYHLYNGNSSSVFWRFSYFNRWQLARGAASRF